MSKNELTYCEFAKDDCQARISNQELFTENEALKAEVEKTTKIAKHNAEMFTEFHKTIYELLGIKKEVAELDPQYIYGTVAQLQQQNKALKARLDDATEIIQIFWEDDWDKNTCDIYKRAEQFLNTNNNSDTSKGKVVTKEVV
jgi:hypothetical protein